MSKKNNGKDNGAKRAHEREIHRHKKNASRERWNLAQAGVSSSGGGGGGAHRMTLSQR
jgi:hypothetical protein